MKAIKTSDNHEQGENDELCKVWTVQVYNIKAEIWLDPNQKIFSFSFQRSLEMPKLGQERPVSAMFRPGPFPYVPQKAWL